MHLNSKVNAQNKGLFFSTTAVRQSAMLQYVMQAYGKYACHSAVLVQKEKLHSDLD